MSFDTDKFESATYKLVEATVPVPELKEFFDEDEEPEFVVRGLTGLEIASARNAKQTNRSMSVMVESLLSSDATEQIEGIKEAIGLTSDVAPDDYVYRLSCLTTASISPSLTHSQVVKLATVHGIIFYKLTNKILELTGQGQTLGE